MSYRTIKRLLGETSLERKCRFLFGGGLLLLITASFYFYAHRNEQLVRQQNRHTARLLMTPVMLANHAKYLEGASKDRSGALDQKTQEQFRLAIQNLTQALKREDLPKCAWDVVPSPNYKDVGADDRPRGTVDADAFRKLDNNEAREIVRIDEEQGQFHFYGALHAEKSCVACHNDPKVIPKIKKKVAEGDFMGMAHISFPLKETNRALANNNAILLAMAIGTTFLAMLAAWAIVRYVIVKPVLHLKTVSDEIAKGNFQKRADIHTGDEFEELSHAFNRMLRHLINVQDDLREMSEDLEGKVDELAEVNLELYEMNKIKDEFLATMSHELRTPLNSILGFSDVLSDSESLDERQKRYVSNIQSSGKELMALISDLLDLAKIESGKMALQPAEFAPADLIARQVDQFQTMADEKNIELTWLADSGVSEMYQDAGKIQQILNNLLSNAIKFTPEGGRIQVRLTPSGNDSATLEVEDTGVGIPLEDQATIFEKFRQGRAALGSRDAITREHGGTGLGLSIVKELTRLLGGSVNLRSEFGKGSTFIIQLPIRKEPDLDDGPLSTLDFRPRASA